MGFGSLGRIARTTWLYAFPATAELVVEPGDARVRAGQPVTLRARLSAAVGTDVRSAPVVVMTTDRGERTASMRLQGDAYELVLDRVDDSFDYRVRAAAVVSDTYEITALRPPRVKQIDVEYRYPAFTGLAPRVETDGGDIYAPAGTEVTLVVQMTKPVAEAALALSDGQRAGADLGRRGDEASGVCGAGRRPLPSARRRPRWSAESG